MPFLSSHASVDPRLSRFPSMYRVVKTLSGNLTSRRYPLYVYRRRPQSHLCLARVSSPWRHALEFHWVSLSLTPSSFLFPPFPCSSFFIINASHNPDKFLSPWSGFSRLLLLLSYLVRTQEHRRSRRRPAQHLPPHSLICDNHDAPVRITAAVAKLNVMIAETHVMSFKVHRVFSSFWA